MIVSQHQDYLRAHSLTVVSERQVSNRSLNAVTRDKNKRMKKPGGPNRRA
jgi:hypothetical protein